MKIGNSLCAENQRTNRATLLDELIIPKFGNAYAQTINEQIE